jgi:hypothetical protein
MLNGRHLDCTLKGKASPLIDKKARNFRVPAVACENQRGISVVVGLIDVRASAYEESDNRKLPLHSGLMQGRQTVLVAFIRIATFGEHVGNARDIPATGGVAKRCGAMGTSGNCEEKKQQAKALGRPFPASALKAHRVPSPI